MTNWKTSYFTCFVLRCLHTVGVLSNDEIHLIGFFSHFVYTHPNKTFATVISLLQIIMADSRYHLYVCRRHRCHYHGGNHLSLSTDCNYHHFHYHLCSFNISEIQIFVWIYKKNLLIFKKKTHSKTIFFLSKANIYYTYACKSWFC